MCNNIVVLFWRALSNSISPVVKFNAEEAWEHIFSPLTLHLHFFRSARFDVDRYFRKKKAPLMTLDVVYNILMDARDTDGNWLYGYRNLPK
jgi:hypothetical protein